MTIRTMTALLRPPAQQACRYVGPEADGFFDEYAESLRHRYPRHDDRTTLFAFRRIFIVATR